MTTLGGHQRAGDHQPPQLMRQLSAKYNGLRIEHADQCGDQSIEHRHGIGEPTLHTRPGRIEVLSQIFDGADVDTILAQGGNQVLQGRSPRHFVGCIDHAEFSGVAVEADIGFPLQNQTAAKSVVEGKIGKRPAPAPNPAQALADRTCRGVVFQPYGQLEKFFQLRAQLDQRPVPQGFRSVEHMRVQHEEARHGKAKPDEAITIYAMALQEVLKCLRERGERFPAIARHYLHRLLRDDMTAEIGKRQDGGVGVDGNTNGIDGVLHQFDRRTWLTTHAFERGCGPQQTACHECLHQAMDRLLREIGVPSDQRARDRFMSANDIEDQALVLARQW
ncbi:hypothetical protein RHSP_05630 [Rhizobium freirei PRF 81]|uniref:Uncharacterized protein n=1 Tax=Rhizobium freirei PRF 81 TaxID=363754 RepID=N6TZ12_9HYPH|nr:hypothetical protein RHSP_05630 [Rhizobium freirei PRF 81]